MAAVQTIPPQHSIVDQDASNNALRAAAAGLGRRFASLIYESLLLTALVLVATFPFVGITQGKVTPAITIALQIYLIVVVGAYFTWFWRHGGQTLPMKTWGIRLIRIDGQSITFRDAAIRYAAAWLGFALAGLGFWWAFWDKDRQFFHDRIAKTRLVDARPLPKISLRRTSSIDVHPGP